MSHLIPPLVSNSPPPMVTGGPDDLDDDFGDFAVPGDINYDGYSLPSSPMHISSSFTASPTPEIPKALHNGDVGHPEEPTVATVQVPKVQTDVSENRVNNSAINSNVDENDVDDPEIISVTESVVDDFADFVSKNESINVIAMVTPESVNELTTTVSESVTEITTETVNENTTAPESDDLDLPDLDLKFSDAADDFDDFGDFESNVPESVTKDEGIEFETDFTVMDDDFGNFNSSAVAVSLSKDDFVKKTEQMIKDIFKADDAVYPEFQPEDFTKNNPVFNKLKIIENTHALNFQWNNAEGQTMLLKSLNIDSRNILYGPRWNPSMPKFASNLGFEPLEPQKTELPTPSTQTEPQQVEVPDAKFDWTSSGLVNPLDCSPDDMLLDLEQLVTTLDLAPTTSSSFLTATTTLAPPPVPADNSPVDDYQTWDHWLQCQASKEEPPDEKQSEIEFKLPDTDVLTLQSETTPQSDNESVNSLKFVTNDNEIENQTVDDDFTNFESYKRDDVSWSPVNLQPLRESHITEHSPIKEEDDFADFQMSLPEKPVEDTKVEVKPVESTVLKPMEPLKPIVLQPTVAPNAPKKIEWPDPGVVDEMLISGIDLSYSVKTVAKPEEEEKEEKEEKEEDDDWSDFVSVTKPQEVKEPFSLLSIPNLQNTQLTCKSLPQMQPPVISPSHKLNSMPSTQQIAVQQLQTGYQPPFQIPLQQPHINSIGIDGTDFEPSLKPVPVSTLETFMMSPRKTPLQPITASVFQPLHSVENSFLNMQQSTLPSTADTDDDDWTDFISVTPAPVSNGFSQKPQLRTITGNIKSTWSDLQPNIITNPVHFDVFHQSSSNKKQTNAPMSAILPELDFATPKNKYFIKK